MDSKLGIIGGMGPMTTAVFIRMIVSMTDVERDQDHIPMVIEHCPGVPDRTSYILDKKSPNPSEAIIEAGKSLAAAGATEIAIPCFTAHYFHDILEEHIPIPVINGIEVVADQLRKDGVNTAGVMATDGTVAADIFKTALEKKGIRCIYPDEADQRGVMSLIFDYVKANRIAPRELFFEICDHLRSAGADTVILGCTEFSVIAESLEYREDITDAMRLLAARCIADFDKRIKTDDK
ncbi:MAG: amino acid racemase [Lachnospiraceae bacterium]|nr:amino acid racemase [Lachnospiraceae bacterium]